MSSTALGARFEQLFSPVLHSALRDRFLHVDRDPYSGPRVYLENAGGGLTLKSVFEADLRVGSLPDNAGRDNPASHEIGRVLKAGRADLATFLNAADGTILSEQSTTSCAFRLLAAAVTGIRGTNLVCTQLDHASFYDAAKVLADRHGLERRITPLNRQTGALDPETVAAQVDGGTVAVSVIHASNITGGKTDLAETVGRIRARAPQAIIIADGAQHTQHGLVDVAASGVDAYVFSAYKVFSKAGFAFAYLGPRLLSLPHAQLLGKANADWDLGTRDAGGFAAFSAVVDYLCWLGAEADPSAVARGRRALIGVAMHAIESHEAALGRRLLHGTPNSPGLMTNPRVVIHGQRDSSATREAVYAFSVQGQRTGPLVKEFGRRGIIVHDRISDAYSRHTLEALGVPEVIRVSLAHYNTTADIDAFLKALQEILAAV